MNDRFLFSGSQHDVVPRALLLDRLLTPLERNTWQVIRMMLLADGNRTLPTYEQLRPYLAVVPGAQASTETVARALTILRLTCWLSLVRQGRTSQGRVQGNVYVLHDQPLTPYEAIQLDPDYLHLLSRALEHASKAVRIVATRVLQALLDDPHMSGKVLPTRLDILAQRLKQRGWNLHKNLSTGHSEGGENNRLRNSGDLISDSEAGAKARKNKSLRHPKSDSTVSNINKILTTTLPDKPERFLSLRPSQQQTALAALHHLDPAIQQQVLQEWDSRCQHEDVRNPGAYLLGILQKAQQGQFNAWARPLPLTSREQPARYTQKQTAPVKLPDKQRVSEHLQNLKAILRGRPVKPM